MHLDDWLADKPADGGKQVQADDGSEGKGLALGLDQGVASSGGKPGSLPRRKIPLSAVPERDGKVGECVEKLKMTRRQILAYSKSWDWPYGSVQEVDRRIGALALRRIARHEADQKRHPHQRKTLETFVKIACDFKIAGYIVYDIELEYLIPHARIRADMKFRARRGDGPEFLFYLEREIKNRPRYWTVKFKKYLDHRQSKGVKPFRVLIVGDSKQRQTSVWKVAHALLGDSGLKIFLFGYSKVVPHGCENSVTEACWFTHEPKLIPLVPNVL